MDHIYQPVRASRSRYLHLRGLRHHLREWGDAAAPLLVLLHGWGDASASFQFLVDALARDWYVVAPDWRGFGESEWTGRPYWFPDYLADLDALLGELSPGAPVVLVGHSLGGNVACLYAGVRPQRVAKLASLEGFGLPRQEVAAAPGRSIEWLDQLAGPPLRFAHYPDRATYVQRLMRDNPRLTAERARFLAQHLALETDAQVVPAIDPMHRLVNPVPYRLEEAMACWRQVCAPTLWVAGEDSFVTRRFAAEPDDYAARQACFADLRERRIADCGHNMHHDQPQRLAEILEDFLGGYGGSHC